LRRPVTGVSWFAARAYCEAQGKRMPTVVEWEYAAAASETKRDASRDPRFSQQVLALYTTRPRPLPPVDAGIVNVYGVRGLHGLAWEWVEDFRGARGAQGGHDARHPDHSHHTVAQKHDQSCAGAAIGAADASNYPAFLRYAIRSGATARTTLSTMGFRCAA
jgi:formylglycine-generating enzyme required for sulfatase activity